VYVGSSAICRHPLDSWNAFQAGKGGPASLASPSSRQESLRTEQAEKFHRELLGKAKCKGWRHQRKPGERESVCVCVCVCV
jgi:hypothetical protein